MIWACVRCHKYSRSFGSIDRVDRWAVWRVLASLLPQTTLPQASPAAQLELDTRARRLRARGVAGNAILGAFRCRSPPSHPTPPPDNPLQTAPFLIARYDDARAKPTHARALRRRRRSLARSIARARCGGGGSVRLHRPSRALRAPRVTRAQRTSSPRIARVITVFRPPRARPARARCSGGGAHSRARLRARGVAVVMVMAVAVGHAARDARNARRASRIRTRASSPRVARVIAGSIPPARTRARAAAAAALARSLDRARSLWRWRRWWPSVTPLVTRLSCAARRARAHARVITAHRARHHRFSSPHAPTRARCDGGGARSLDSARAVWRWQWRTVMRTSCVSRASRARARASSSSRHGTC